MLESSIIIVHWRLSPKWDVEMTERGELPVGATGPRIRRTRPWYELRLWCSIPGYTVSFGHWASLRGYNGTRIIGLDAGIRKEQASVFLPSSISYEFNDGNILREGCPDPDSGAQLMESMYRSRAARISSSVAA